VDGAGIEGIQGRVEIGGAEALAAGERGDVAAHVGELVVADGHAEVLADDVFDFVGLIEDHGGVFGDNAAVLVLLGGEVGEEEVVIDDDNVALGGLAAHGGEEATVELGALLAGAEFAAGV
jgi:hypothetical protein